jgi:hypothetical protein
MRLLFTRPISITIPAHYAEFFCLSKKTEKKNFKEKEKRRDQRERYYYIDERLSLGPCAKKKMK